MNSFIKMVKNMKPLILITNDDGIRSPGLAAAALAVEDLADILIAAPHAQQTGMGRAFTRSPDGGIIEKEDMTVNGHEVMAYAVHGTPALSVAHGVLELADRKPALCISGINYGENMGNLLTCSGTLGAAFEAASHNIPAIAVSLEAEFEKVCSDNFEQKDWRPAMDMLRRWAVKILDEGMPPNTDVLNINVPSIPDNSKMYRITTQSRQNYFEFIKPGKRLFHKPFRMDSRLYVDEDTLEEDSDIYAVYKDRIISVTPISKVMSVRL